MSSTLRLIGRKLVGTVRGYIYKLLIPKGFVVTRIDKGQLYIFDPSDSVQGFLLCTTGKYGTGTELLAQ